MHRCFQMVFTIWNSLKVNQDVLPKSKTVFQSDFQIYSSQNMYVTELAKSENGDINLQKFR